MQNRTFIARFDRRVLWALLGVSASLAGLVLSSAMPGKSAQSISSDSPTLDLSQAKLTFSEEFNGLDVSARGPGTRWTTHTPWNGDFGDAVFSNPAPAFPFTIENGVLRIEARKLSDGKWRSGLLSSVDPQGHGFAQQYGYFEMRAKLPTAAGLWPAFWLVGTNWAGRGDSKTTYEIDALEYYGQNSPDWFESTVHVWYHDGSGRKFNVGTRNKVPAGTRFDDYHTYGVRVRPDFISFYFDRVEIWKTKAPPLEYHQPMMVLVNLAMGSGYPTTSTPNPSFMYVDYIRVYSE